MATVKINDLTIELPEGVTLEVAPDGKSIKITAPAQWPIFTNYPTMPSIYPLRPYIDWGPTCTSGSAQ